MKQSCGASLLGQLGLFLVDIYMGFFEVFIGLVDVVKLDSDVNNVNVQVTLLC